MGIFNSQEIFQEKINEMFFGFEFIRTYINYLLIITKGDWSDHLKKLEQVLKSLKDNGLKCNIEKSFFWKTEMEYLGFWMMRNGILPVKKSGIHSEYDSTKEY